MNTDALGSQRFRVTDYDVLAGMDVDKRSIVVTWATYGDLLGTMKVPYDAQNLIGYARKHFPGKRIAFIYEAGCTGYGLHDALEAGGYRCVVATPSLVPRAPGARVKTNRIDSRRLVAGLRSGEVQSIRVPTVPYRDLRHLVQLRNTYAQLRRGTKCRIKALLLCEGLKFPEAPHGGQWTARVVTALRELPCRPAVRLKLDSLLDTLAFTHQQLLQARRATCHLCKGNEELATSLGYLLSVPGVGWTIGVNVLARVGDWRQLKVVRELGMFFGLVPREDSTGEDADRGAITHTGDGGVRSMIVEGAWVATRKDETLKALYDRVYARNPKQRAAGVAITAVARKMTMLMFCVLKEQRPYVAAGRPPKAQQEK